ncbi:MAG: plasmid mobilization relaxosome protein MobC [Nitrospiraceae bacterium]
MARYLATDASERRTAKVTVQLAPTERQRLEEAAAREGKALSDYVRQLCLRRGGRTPVVAGTRRNPDAKALADELRAIGINLNQLARVANQTGEIRREGELSMVIDRLVETMDRVIRL